MRRLIFALTASVFGFTTLASADVVITAGSAGTAVAGRDTEINVYFLNTGPAAERVVPPQAIPAKLTIGAATVITELRRQGGEGSHAVAPGAFHAARYAVAVPTTATGTMAIELNQPGSPRMAV